MNDWFVDLLFHLSSEGVQVGVLMATLYAAYRTTLLYRSDLAEFRSRTLLANQCLQRARAANQCTRCGYRGIEPGAKFCSGCGHTIPDLARVDDPTSHAAFVPPLDPAIFPVIQGTKPHLIRRSPHKPWIDQDGVECDAAGVPLGLINLQIDQAIAFWPEEVRVLDPGPQDVLRRQQWFSEIQPLWEDLRQSVAYQNLPNRRAEILALRRLGLSWVEIYQRLRPATGPTTRLAAPRPYTPPEDDSDSIISPTTMALAAAARVQKILLLEDRLADPQLTDDERMALIRARITLEPARATRKELLQGYLLLFQPGSLAYYQLLTGIHTIEAAERTAP